MCEALINEGESVVCVDDFSSGSESNVAHLISSPCFELIVGDACEVLTDISGPISSVSHLASPAAPPDYLARPLETLSVGSRGTEAGLKLANSHGARFLLASTSEVYGDPLVHPQVESYWGNVNPVGPRSVYDEAKRFSESLAAAYRRTLGSNTGIVRIFNTYGPRLRAGDGRVVSNFVVQALSNEPLTVYGDGSQTRSLCYVDDLVQGLLSMIRSQASGPVNLGNPTELTVLQLAKLVLRLTGSGSQLVHRPLPQDDPTRRRPDVTLAKSVLNWEPNVQPEEGILRTISWFQQQRDRLQSGPGAPQRSPAPPEEALP